MVSALITLAKSLGKTTVAEGVETARQLEVLAELGGNLVQGYHFSRPVAPEEFADLLVSKVPV